MPIIIGNWNDTLPAAPAGHDNVKFQVDRIVSPPNISANIPRADIAGTKYGTIIYDGSDNPLYYLGADGEWHDVTGPVTDHVAEGDPHTQYQKEAEKDAANGYVGLDASSNANVAGRVTARAFTGGWVVTTPPVDSDTRGIWLPRIADLNQNLIYDYQDELYYATKRGTVALTANGTPVAEALFENIFVNNSLTYGTTAGNSPFPVVIEVDLSAAPIAANGSGYYSLGLTFRVNPQIPTHIKLEQWNSGTSAWATAIDVDITTLTYNSVYLSPRFLALAGESYSIKKLKLTLSGNNPLTASFYLQRFSLYHATAAFDPWNLSKGGGALYGAVNMKAVAMLKADGSLGMASLSDASAANSSLFVGPDHDSKLCYKGAGGTVAPHVALDESDLIPTAEMGTGEATAAKFLRGDRTWATVDASTTPITLEIVDNEVAVDASLGSLFYIEASDNFTLLNPTNAYDGWKALFVVKQTDGGSHTISLDTAYRGSATLPLASVVLSTNDEYLDYIEFIYFEPAERMDLLRFLKGFIDYTGLMAVAFEEESIDPYFDPQPAALLSTEEYASDAGQFTTYTEGTIGTITIDGQLKLIHNAGAARNTIITRTDATFEIPHLFVSIDVVSTSPQSTSYHNFAVGIVKDANNFLFCTVDRVAQSARMQCKIGGVNTWVYQGNKAWTRSEPYKLGLSLVGNSCCIWVDTGSGWTFIAGASVAAYYDFTTSGALAGWKAGVGLATGANGTTYFDNLKWGSFGGVGMRDMTIVTNEDGTPYFDGDYVYFTATTSDARGQAACTIHKMHMTTYAISQTAAFMVTRGGKVYHDHAGHIIKCQNGSFRLLVSTWGNGFGGDLKILHKLISDSPQPDLLSGAWNIEDMVELTLPGVLDEDYGAYDPMMFFDADYESPAGRWVLAYCVVDDTSFAGNHFYCAAAYSFDLETWYSIGEDTGAEGYEGSKIVAFLDQHFIVVGGPAGDGDSSRVYDIDMKYLGALTIPFEGGASTQPHPMIFVGEAGTQIYCLTFDNTEFESTDWTWGQPQVWKAAL